MPKKKDFILIGVLLVIALIGLGVTQFLQHQTGASVTITIGGEIYGTYPLDQSRTIEIDAIIVPVNAGIIGERHSNLKED